MKFYIEVESGTKTNIRSFSWRSGLGSKSTAFSPDLIWEILKEFLGKIFVQCDKAIEIFDGFLFWLLFLLKKDKVMFFGLCFFCALSKVTHKRILVTIFGGLRVSRVGARKRLKFGGDLDFLWIPLGDR